MESAKRARMRIIARKTVYHIAVTGFARMMKTLTTAQEIAWSQGPAVVSTPTIHP
jgi:hypothetical protein